VTPESTPRRFRYAADGRWFKGNCHLHSTHSDGGRTTAELAELYAAAGYDFLVRTDHWAASDVAVEEPDVPLLWLDGVELDGEDPETGSYYHVVGLGRFEGLSREMGLLAGMEAVREQGGLLTLAHPHWCGNTFNDALRHGFDGVEIYNHVCRWLNGKGDGLSHWDRMLEERPETLGLAVDDAHLRPEHPGWNGGWTVVRAGECTREAVMGAIRSGNFYSSQGPEFASIEWNDGAVRLHTSPVSFVRLVGPASLGARIGSFEGEVFTEAAFAVPEEWVAARIEIEDPLGRRAWTNPLFTSS
jgi:hypothetical protein